MPPTIQSAVFSALNMPEGLSISPSGIISGTPTTVGGTDVPVSVTTDFGSASGSVHINVIDRMNAVTANATLGNTDLGVFTEAHSTAIRAGDFTNLNPGNKFTINGHSYLIGECDYLWGKEGVSQHHLLMIPESNMYEAQMNTTGTTSGGYNGSRMHSSNLDQAKTQINTDFGSDHVLARPNNFSSAVSSGVPTSYIAATSTVDLMSEFQVFGAKTFSKDFDSSIKSSLYAYDDHQIALFVLDPSKRATGNWWWLRDVCSSDHFCSVASGGSAYANLASASRGVRPAFLIY